jgi:hypothetical protein
LILSSMTGIVIHDQLSVWQVLRATHSCALRPLGTIFSAARTILGTNSFDHLSN